MRIIFIILCSIAFAGCNKTLSTTVNSSVDKAADQVGCSNLSSSVWDVVTTSLIDDLSLPEAKVVSQSLSQKMSAKFQGIHASKVDKVSDAVAEFIAYLQNEFSQTKDSNLLLETVVALEVGDHSDEVAIARQKQLDMLIKKIDQASVGTEQTCTPTTPETPVPVVPRTVAAMSFGAKKAMATAYQSCQSYEKPALDHNTPKLRGIKYDGMHPDGIGRRRLIGNLSEIQASHPYLETAYAANCRKVANNPLIYDYGGKPYTSSAEDSALDFFQDAGSGTKVLGIDCSGFVFSSIATAGLRIAPNTALKAKYVHGIPARFYMNPEQNGLGCFERIKVGVSGDLKEGDVIAGTGHINIVESAGADPFGINNARTETECNAITSDNFDFVVAQSSTSIEGVGINRMQVRDYLIESPTFDPGLEDYAKQACKARLAKKDVLLARSDLRIVRHKGTAACKATKPIALVGESCITSCPGMN